MDIKGMISTGAMIIIGIIALKAFGGVKGITEMIGGVSELLGTGGAAAAAPAVGIIAPETIEQIEVITEMPDPEIALVVETQKTEATYDIIDMLAWVGGPFWAAAMPYITAPFEEAAKADILETYAERRGATPPAAYTPSAIPVYQPPTTAIMEIIMPTDPAHPATDPFLGGR